MKRLLITLFAVLLSVICLAQQQVAKVTLKNGTVLTGQVSELNPISHVKLIVGGLETTINMADVASIENVKDEKADKQKNVQGQTAIIPEAHDYDGLPELYNLKVGPYVVEMKLIKGTTFSMGYDGDGSMRMDSEPVHDVTLTSFYINTSPLDKDLVGYLKKGKEEHSKRSSVYHPFTRKDAKGCKKQTFLQQFSEKLISAVFRKEDSAFWLDFFVIMSKKGRVVAVATATTLPGA